MKKKMKKKTRTVIETYEENVSRRLPLAGELLEQKSHEEIIELVKKWGIKGSLLDAIIKKSNERGNKIEFIEKLRRASKGKEIEGIKEGKKALFKKVMEGRILTHNEIVELAEILKEMSKTLSMEKKKEIKKPLESREVVKKT